jgi:hypothetical protein
VPTNARKTRWYSTGGPWGTGLLLLGLAVTVQGIGYLLAPADEFTGALAWVNHSVPIRAWALLWIAAGCFSTFRALTPPQRHTDVSPVVGVVCVWSAFYFAFRLQRPVAARVDAGLDVRSGLAGTGGAGRVVE